MTQSQIDGKIYEMKVYIADKFRDIQMQSQTLKNVEDETKVLQALAKISDFSEEIKRGYYALTELENEEVTEEKNSYSSYI